MFEECPTRGPAKSHGTGCVDVSQFAEFGTGAILEPGVLIFHPESIRIANDVYVGHGSILKGYYQNEMVIGEGTWVGQQCFFHSAGGIRIGRNVGIGPGVKILTSSHALQDCGKPILHNEIEISAVEIADGSDIGVGAIVLPGVRIGCGAQVGAGAVVTKDVEDFSIHAGIPARQIGMRQRASRAA